MKTIPKLLVLEDNAGDLDLLRMQLQQEKFPCELLVVNKQSDYETAIAREEFDLILSDYTLPGYDGLSALRLAHQQRPTVPFIFLSGTMGEERAVESLQQGAADYILKSRGARLVPAIRRALEQSERHQEWQKAEQALSESEQRFRQLAEQSADGFWFTELNPERMVYVSPAMTEIWGIPEERFYREPRAWMTAIHVEDQDRVHDAFEAWLARDIASFREKFRVIQPGASSRWVSATGTLICDKTGNLLRVSGIARDITEQKRIEERFLRMQRLESIGTLASGVAHDLNNILVPILMAAPLLRDDMPQVDREKLVAVLESSAQRGAGIVRQVLTFARGTNGDYSLLQPVRLLDEIAKIIERTFPKSIVLRRHHKDAIRIIEADPTQLHQVLLNLCVNARDAMPVGGILTLAVENFDVDAHYASMIPGATPGPHIVLQVSDTGRGIARHVIDKIFDPFFTTKEIGEGTGLGLSTTLGIVKSHGGFVNVSSERGQTVFKVFLPAKGDADSLVPPPSSADIPEGHGETLLVVDDEAVVLEAAVAVLTAHGYKTLVARNGIEALALFAQHAGSIDVVLTDISMPFMDGLTMGRAMRKMEPGIKIIISTGRDDYCPSGENAALQVDGRLSKPYTRATLLHALDDVTRA